MCRFSIHHLSSQIREEAVRLGFLKAGIAPAGALSTGDHFNAWLEKGFNGEMHYLERQAPKRLDPRMVLPNARSLLVLALNYYTGESAVDGPMKGRISRYALGDDYHSIVKERLERLLGFIQKLHPSARGICFSDTGPVMEKAWGAQTSLGWMGKNTTLISRNLGSWFFLGVILLDIELEYDSRQESRCGSCRRCIDACPTGAIVAPYLLDARRCISYLTIEYRGPIPRALRPLMGNRIFGCDDCQDSCPWNRFATKTAGREFCASAGNRAPDLISLAQISVDSFRKQFKLSPIWRATRDGFVRNVVVALGNSGSATAIPALEKALCDSSPLVRAHAAWALGRLATDNASRILEAARTGEGDPAVLQEIRMAMARSLPEPAESQNFNSQL